MKCDICGKDFNDVMESLSHMKEEHPKELNGYIEKLAETSGYNVDLLNDILKNGNLFTKIAKDVEKEKKKKNNKRKIKFLTKNY